MRCSASTLKTSLPPDRYYSAHLTGSWGKPSGQDWHLWDRLCPFHQDRQAGSFVVNRATGAFKCFSCGAAGGDIIDFHMKANQLDFKAAFSQLQEIAQ